ncbi:NRDE family protein [Desertibacillus haloalkaliphilus]|uniref:NRDE family protein n=1 Tax=Desertibacillus haloalkaliphilus TaxID=1328930 RepID=UPI001C25C150|nr:NRDE family protein [Desertibacillus haloalkaliphilus]MBU8907328.1 NRDE family protein [Desertibacillus haloalkaliphilus]
MCLINFAYRYHPNYLLVIAANRDEFYRRPTEQATFWSDHPHVFAGRDLEMQGTWMGMTTAGRFAAITNYRELKTVEQPISRGALVKDFLCGDDSPHDYLQAIRKDKDTYNGFNLLVGTQSDLLYYSNREDVIRTLTPGVHGLSNHLLNTPWPKVTRGKQSLKDCLDQTNSNCSMASILETLQDEKKAADECLPKTGVSLELERLLSSVFIKSEGYGTRSSTVITVDYNGHVEFHERTYRNDGLAGINDVSVEFTIH